MLETKIHPHELWTTQLFFAEWPEHQTKAPGIIEHIYGIRNSESANIAGGVSPGAKSRQGLFESRFDLFSSGHGGLQNLIGFISQVLQSVVAQVNHGRVSPAEIVVNPQGWFHITNDGGHHDAHFHGNCSWCGIYYLQSGDAGSASASGVPQNGCNRFYSPIATGGGYIDFGNEHLQNEYFDVAPKDGVLVVFPSYLLHSALPYQGNDDRIVISFNIQVFRSNIH